MILDLPDNTVQTITTNAKACNMSIEQYIESLLPPKNLAFEHGKNIFGQYTESDDGTLSQNIKARVKQIIKDKHDID